MAEAAGIPYRPLLTAPDLGFDYGDLIPSESVARTDSQVEDARVQDAGRVEGVLDGGHRGELGGRAHEVQPRPWRRRRRARPRSCRPAAAAAVSTSAVIASGSPASSTLTWTLPSARWPNGTSRPPWRRSPGAAASSSVEGADGHGDVELQRHALAAIASVIRSRKATEPVAGRALGRDRGVDDLGRSARAPSQLVGRVLVVGALDDDVGARCRAVADRWRGAEVGGDERHRLRQDQLDGVEVRHAGAQAASTATASSRLAVATIAVAVCRYHGTRRRRTAVRTPSVPSLPASSDGQCSPTVSFGSPDSEPIVEPSASTAVDAGDLGPHRAEAHHPRPAGVGGDGAADGGRVAAGEVDRRVEAGGAGVRTPPGQRDAGAER